MGLDITYFRRLTKQAPPAPDFDPDAHWEKGWRSLFGNPDFPGHAPEIEDGAFYSAADEDVGGFRAGSYGGYNVWRDQLAQLAGWPSAQAVWNGKVATGPFVELINFSDCEGVIGAGVSAKLAKDFAAYQPKADAHPDEYFRAKYAEWRRAFEAAADGGAVEFH